MTFNVRRTLPLGLLVAGVAAHDSSMPTASSKPLKVERCYRCFEQHPAAALTQIFERDGRQCGLCTTCLQRADTESWLAWAWRGARTDRALELAC